MNNSDLIGFAIALTVSIAVWFFVLTTQEIKCDWDVTITYLNGETEELLFMDSPPPKVEKNGCVYDYYYHTWICGVRHIRRVPRESNN